MGFAFGDSKSNVEKKISSLSDEVADLKNQKKLAELDFEKRIILLESALSTINKTIGSAKNLKELKESLDQFMCLEGKLNELEDKELIDRLENMQSEDGLRVLEDNVGSLSKKLDLLADAVKTLGAHAGGGSASAVADKISSGSSDAELIRAEIESLRTGKADRQAIDSVEAKVGALEKSIKDIDKGFSELATSARETLKKRDNDLIVLQEELGEIGDALKKTRDHSSEIDALRDADKKMEALISSLRNQLAIAEEKIKPLQAAPEIGRKTFSEMLQLKKDLDAAKKDFEETLRSHGEEHAKRIDESSKALETELKKISEAHPVLEKEHAKTRKSVEEIAGAIGKSAEESAKSREDLEELQKKMLELESRQGNAENIASSIDSLADAGAKMSASLASLQNKISFMEPKLASIDRLQKEGKEASLEMVLVRKDIDAAKKSFDGMLASHGLEFEKKIHSSHASPKDELKKVFDAYASIEKDHERMAARLEDLNKTLEERVKKSAEDVLKRQTRLHEDSLAELQNSNKNIERIGKELDDMIAETNAKYQKICSVLGEKNVQEFMRRLDKLKAYEESIKTDVHSGVSDKVKELVDEELRDVTANLKKISDMAYKQQVKPEDVEHIVDSKLAAVSAEYNRMGKAIGTLQRIVREEHAEMGASAHKKIEDDVSPIKDEIADLREDVEALKNMRGDLVDDINKLLAGHKNGAEAEGTAVARATAEPAVDFEAEKASLEDMVNKKLADFMQEMENEYAGKAQKSQQSQAGMEHIKDKLSALERENHALRDQFEELKDAYFRIMKLQQGSPVIIE